MKEVQINRDLILREDGKLFNVHTGEEFIPKNPNTGYYRVRTPNGHKYVHRLVMELFGPPKPGPEYEIDHRNQNRLDNDINNLRWVTRQENNYNKGNNRELGKRKCDISCKDYQKISNDNYYIKNKEKENLRNNNYRKDHLDKANETSKRWRQNHPEEYKKRQHEYYLKRKLKKKEGN